MTCLTNPSQLQVVQEGGSAEALFLLFLLHNPRRRIRRFARQRHWENGRDEGIQRLEMGVHSRYVIHPHELFFSAFLMRSWFPEGTLTCVVSFFLYFTISDFPEDAKWLTQEEKEFVKARLYEDVGYSKRNESLTLRRIMDVFKDCKSCPNMTSYPSAYSAHRQSHRRRFHVLRSHCSRVRIWYVPLIAITYACMHACIWARVIDLLKSHHSSVLRSYHHPGART